MPLVNIGAARTRSLVVALAGVNPVDSIGIGTNDDAEALTDVSAGLGGTSSWKSTDTTATRTDSSGTDDENTTDPWWQLEDTWDTSEFNGNIVFEIVTGADTLDGEDPAGDDGTALYSRKRVGGATGLGKTADYSLVARVRFTYPSS